VKWGGAQVDGYILNPYRKGEKPSRGGHGWLNVRDETNGSVISLPMYLKVRIENARHKGDQTRDYFTIMEGLYVGKKASVSKISETNCQTLWFWNCNTTYESRILTPPKSNPSLPRSGPCTVRYKKVESTKVGYKAITERTTLDVGRGLGKSFVSTFSGQDVIHQFDLLKPGTYKLRIPDYEHVTKGQKYLSESLFATTWYVIDEPLYIDDPSTESLNEQGKKNRYFHIGNGSAGCLTVRSKSRWTEIVDYVSKSRLDSQYVGYVEVLDKD